MVASAHTTRPGSVSGELVLRIRYGSSPICRDATAVDRAWFDWMPPIVTTESCPLSLASHNRNSNFRTLFPDKSNDDRSSRLIKNFNDGIGVWPSSEPVLLVINTSCMLNGWIGVGNLPNCSLLCGIGMWLPVLILFPGKTGISTFVSHKGGE